MRTKQRPPSSKTLHPPTGRRKPPLSRTNAVLLSSLFSIQFHYLSFPHVTFSKWQRRSNQSWSSFPLWLISINESWLSQIFKKKMKRKMLIGSPFSFQIQGPTLCQFPTDGLIASNFIYFSFRWPYRAAVVVYLCFRNLEEGDDCVHHLFLPNFNLIYLRPLFNYKLTRCD